MNMFFIFIYRMFPDYYETIQNPTDLSTIKKKLNSKEYATVTDVLTDIRLVWDNCCLYNAEESDIFVSAATLSEYTEALVKVCIKPCRSYISFLSDMSIVFKPIIHYIFY